MISLDWKERLVRDSQDFLERKIPMGDYDFDIIYNAYPERIENKVPRDVVVLVSSTLASAMAKNPDQYKTFFDYIWEKKGENGKVAFACILGKVMSRKHNEYMDYVKAHLFKADNANDIALLLEKTLYPIFKKNPAQYFDTLIQWIREDNEQLSQCIIKMLMKLLKNESDLLRKFFAKMENRWMNASPNFIKINAFLIKSIAKTDETMYFSIYESYKNTRDPNFVEILTGGLTLYSDNIKEYYENWAKSGNARVKKAALTGLKFLKKKGSE